MPTLPSAPDAISRLHARAVQIATDLPDTVPASEYLRSPAASAIAELAARSGLFHFHFEHRSHRELPEAWTSEPGQSDPPMWSQGMLPERKYHSFRHDHMIASYHPHHRTKWAAHELCHKLVGFGWAPDATPFFHATACRTAELLPVALWYFFDEAFLRRCPGHADAGVLFTAPCAACEALASADPADRNAEARVREGLAFLDAELAAITRSRREKRPIPHLWATINLCHDGVNYARAQAARLRSSSFRAFADRLLIGPSGCSETLDALEARVVAVAHGLCLTGEPDPWASSPAHGRWRWILQDVGAQLAAVLEETDGEASDGILDLLDRLGDAMQATLRADDPTEAVTSALLATREGYDGLFADFELPDPAEVFALGYAAPGAATGAAHLRDGLLSCAPILTGLLDNRLPGVVRRFAAADRLERTPLPQRFAAWVNHHHPGPLADLAAWEAAVAALPPTGPVHLPGPAVDGHRLGEHVAVLRLGHDVLALAEGVESGRYDVDDALQIVTHDGVAPEPCPTVLLLARDAMGEIVILDVDPETADDLDQRPIEAHLDEGEAAAMADAGMLVPLAWPERA